MSVLLSRCRPTEAEVLRRALGEATREPREERRMNLLIAAGLLAVLSVVLLGPFSKWLSQAAWVSRAPRAAVLCWQCIGLGAIAAGIGAGTLRGRGPLSARVCRGRQRAGWQPLQWPPPAGPGPLRRTRADPRGRPRHCARRHLRLPDRPDGPVEGAAPPPSGSRRTSIGCLPRNRPHFGQTGRWPTAFRASIRGSC